MTPSRADRADYRELFAKAKRDGDIRRVAEGLNLVKAGHGRLRGECPSCKASKRRKGKELAAGAFWVDPNTGTFGCFAECGFKGDVIDLEAFVSRISKIEAAERLAGQKLEPRKDGDAPRAEAVSTAPAASSAAERETPKAKVQRWQNRVLREAVPIAGTPAELYLARRAVTADRLPWWDIVGSRRLLYHPAVPFAWNETRRDWDCWPAMIAQVRTPGGLIDGLHVTYLARFKDRVTGERFWAKAPIEPSKRMWGAQKDDLGRHAGVWLVGPEGDEPVIVAEGIESALSAAILYGRPCRVLATLSLGRLQGEWKLDKYGRLNPDLVAGDPDKPALTWPGVDEAIIAVDHDMKPIRVKCRKATGGTYQRELTATERARICGALARQAWRRAGTRRVSVMAPGVGRDFNNELEARVGG